MANEIEIRVTSTNASKPGFADVTRDARTMAEGVAREAGRAFGSMTSEAHRAGQEVSEAVGRAFNELTSEAREGGQEAGRALTRELEQSLDRTEQAARDAGQDAGRAFTRGATERMRDARGRFVSAGEDAGEGFGDGAEDSGRGRMRGLAGSLATTLRAAPWAAAGLAVGALILEGIQGAMEAETATASLQAQLGEFGAEGERLAKSAGNLFRDAYGESLGEVNEAIVAVVTSIRGMRGANASAVEDMTSKAMALGEAFGVEVARAVQVVGQLVKTNLVKDADEGMDLLTAALQRVPSALRDDLVDALDEYGPFMEQIGIKGQRAFNILVAASDKGMYGLDKAGDAFKELTLKIASAAPDVDAALRGIGMTQAQVQDAFAKGGEEGRRAFEKIVKGLLAIKDPGARAEQAIALFGTPLEDLNTKDIPAFLRGLIDTKDRLGDVEGAAGKVGDRLHDTAQTRITSFTRTLKGELVDFLGGTVLGSLEEFTDEAGEVFEEWFSGNSEMSEELRATWEKFGETFGEIFDDIKEWIEENRDEFEDWGEKLADIVTYIAEAVQAGLDIVLELWEKFGPTILEVVGVVAETLIGWWRGLFRTLKGVYETFAGLFTGDWERMWEGIKDIAAGLGEAIWSVIKGAFGLIVATFRGTWRLIGGIVKGYLDDVKEIASKAMNWLSGVFDRFFDRAKKAWRNGVAALKSIWRGIQSATRDPVKFVVDVVYNNGIRKVWNFVAGIAGMKQLDRLSFQDGGVVDVRKGGVAPGFSARDNRLGLFRDGEGVLVPEAVQSLGPGFIHAANKAGHRAKDLMFGGDPGTRSGRIPGFQFGGIVGGIKDAIGRGIDWAKGAPKLLVDKGITAWASKVLEPGKGDPGGRGWWGSAIGRLPRKMIGEFIGWVKKNLEDLFQGGGDFGKALAWAKNQAGKPYVWGGVGPGGYDCSGFMSAITNVIRGDNPYSRLFTTFSFSPNRGTAGFVPGAASDFRVGVTNAGVGHMAGTLNGVNVESRGSAGVVVGRAARGANDGLFNMRFGYRGKADNGAVLSPGWNEPLYNGTGTLEELRPVDQLPRELHINVYIDNHGVIGSQVDVQNMFVRVLEELVRQGRLDTIVQQAVGS
ncbi:phage tail tape measure protein [Actinomadura sp. 21ATH]|uniref:phage tail tape measure protein n=1 Tax=Actinomadura sp. 21ATH TaxID=1735444 RepID=UPI0035C0F753